MPTTPKPSIIISIKAHTVASLLGRFSLTGLLNSLGEVLLSHQSKAASLDMSGGLPLIHRYGR